MLDKIAYRNNKEEELVYVKPEELPLSVLNKDSATESGGRNGFVSQEMTTEPSYFKEDDDSLAIKEKYNSGPPVDIKKLFLELGDGLDLSGEEKLANFADFMLFKIAETEDNDPEESFRKLIIRIVNTDIPDTNTMIKKITKIFSRTVVLEMLDGATKEEAKSSAYKKIVHRSNQYLSE